MAKRTTSLSLRAMTTAWALAMVLLVAVSCKAQTYSVLYSFTGGADGGYPAASLILDRAGNLYGTTSGGGLNNCGFLGACGVVFKLNSSTGVEKVLYSFCPGSGSCTDGSQPGFFFIVNGNFIPVNAALVRDAAGNLYGTTSFGGSSASMCGFGSPCGVVFKLDKAGNETVLYNFCSLSNCADGAEPASPLIRDAAGNLYGTTYGTVYKIDATGVQTVLHTFNGYPTDGAVVAPSLVRDPVGNLYGVTYEAGAYGDGVAFKLSSTGKESIHSFVGGKNGQNPFGGLMPDAQGNFYGVTVFGGTAGGGNCSIDGCGTIFKLDAHNRETDLYSFTGVNGDGANPYSSLIEDAEGNLYGTTYAGGAYGSGTVFKLDKTGQETVLYSFCSGGWPCTDGSNPFTGLVRDAAGNLYGTASGGANGAGIVFKIAP